MISEKERQLQEASQEIDTLIDKLIDTNFLDKDIVLFGNTMRRLRNISGIQRYLLAVLYDKIGETYLRVRPTDEIINASYRKLLSIVISIDDSEIIDYMETYFLKDRNPNYFFILLEEKIKQNKSISNAETLFISLIAINQMKVKDIHKFLSIIEKGPDYLVNKFLQGKAYYALRYYIKILSFEKLDSSITNTLDPIVSQIIKFSYSEPSPYISLVTEILNISNKYTHQLLDNDLIDLDKFCTMVVSNNIYQINIIKHLSEYLSEYYIDKLDDFEKSILSTADGAILVTYSIVVPTSNKRKILKRLVEMRESRIEEENLVEFIRHFPEYKSLLLIL
jgi:hypothetical protein